MSWPDYFSGHARDYARYRPTYPAELFEAIAAACRSRRLAWDCAAGNGQATRSLVPLFERVVATDASADQLANAAGGAHFARVVCRAEAAAIGSGRADLIVVAQALHWFADERFFREVARVAAPGGVLAAWCYNLMRVAPRIDALIDRFYRQPVGPYWAPERRHIESGLRSVDIPFQELDPPETVMTARWTLREALGYVATWSAVKRCHAATGEDPLPPLAARLEPLWGAGARDVVWPLGVRLHRVHR